MRNLTPKERSLIVTVLAILVVGTLVKYWRDRSQIERIERVERSRDLSGDEIADGKPGADLGGEGNEPAAVKE